jgi:hypothetical protein
MGYVVFMNEIQKAAQLLGRRAKGKHKRFSEEEIAKRTKRILEAGKKRWQKNEDSAVNKM